MLDCARGGQEMNQRFDLCIALGIAWVVVVAAEMLGVESGLGYLVLAAEIKVRENRRVSASELIEGMVLAHDVRNGGGLLLLAAGSRLTCTSAQKLAKMLGDRIYLEVAPAG